MPGIQPDVVVIAAGGDEGCRVPVHGHQLEAHHADVEVERLFDTGHLQMDVTYVGPFRDRSRSGVFCVKWMHEMNAEFRMQNAECRIERERQTRIEFWA
jgi:hypothetical protein